MNARTQFEEFRPSDIAEQAAQCRAHFEWFDRLNEARQAVLVDMCLHIGIERLTAFQDMLDSIRDERYANAAEHLRQSCWAHNENPTLAVRLSFQLDSGEFQL